MPRPASLPIPWAELARPGGKQVGKPKVLVVGSSSLGILPSVELEAGSDISCPGTRGFTGIELQKQIIKQSNKATN